MFYGSILLWTWNGITSSTYVQNRSTLDPIDQLITGWPVSSCRVGPWSNVNFSMVLALLPSFHGLQLATWKKVFGWCLELDGLYLASYVWYIYFTHYIHIYIYLYTYIYIIFFYICIYSLNRGLTIPDCSGLWHFTLPNSKDSKRSLVLGDGSKLRHHGIL